jgi:hypothetical protein
MIPSGVCGSECKRSGVLTALKVIGILVAIFCVATGVGLSIDKHDPNWTPVHRATAGIIFIGFAAVIFWAVFHGF